ncbi:MAG TPA: GNAT family N-acetyltransferase [Planctomycetota bacterium]|nr:GNAT family N-acetyltransferase [Planctomycetota bacterium]
MIGADILHRVDRFWAGYFGCSPEDLNRRGVLVLPHRALEGYDGVLVFRHGETCVVSVPEMTPEIERERLRKATPEQAFDPDFLSRNFVVWKDRVSPPAWVGILDPARYKAVATTARLLSRDDEKAVRGLAEGCGEIAWKQSKLTLDREPNFGLFLGDDLVAASGYLAMGQTIAYIGVVTHPQHRGKGYARQVVTASVKHAFERNLIPMWRTPQANEAAVALAKAIGFEQYSSTRDVQLVEDEF